MLSPILLSKKSFNINKQLLYKLVYLKYKRNQKIKMEAEPINN